MIQYDANGGTGTAPAAQVYANGEESFIPAVKGNLTKYGHEFIGWSTLPNGRGLYFTPYTSYPTSVFNNGVTTLYALWIRSDGFEHSSGLHNTWCDCIPWGSNDQSDLNKIFLLWLVMKDDYARQITGHWFFGEEQTLAIYDDPYWSSYLYANDRIQIGRAHV